MSRSAATPACGRRCSITRRPITRATSGRSAWSCSDSSSVWQPPCPGAMPRCSRAAADPHAFVNGFSPSCPPNARRAAARDHVSVRSRSMPRAAQRTDVAPNTIVADGQPRRLPRLSCLCGIHRAAGRAPRSAAVAPDATWRPGLTHRRVLPPPRMTAGVRRSLIDLRILGALVVRKEGSPKRIRTVDPHRPTLRDCPGRAAGCDDGPARFPSPTRRTTSDALRPPASSFF
jgi:hypothetical protein